jgi:hypothetical protein
MEKVRVFADTNVILEAFRTDCWPAICQRYAIETVEKCIEEALTGDPNDRRYIRVDRVLLTNGLSARHAVSKSDVASLILQHPHCHGLDAGELHLLAWLHSAGLLPNALVLLSTADKAAIVATRQIGWMDSVVSLEELAHKSGATRAQLDGLAQHYRGDWLDGIKTKIHLGIIP